jgi:FKBP-type peptidyl-prolyl cis-trans isomerase FkpA
MRKTIFLFCLLAVGMSLDARAIREEADLSLEKGRISYAFGMLIGSEFISSGLEIDYNSFIDGLKTVMENEATKISQDEAMELADLAFQAAVTRQNEEKRIKEMIFLAGNAERPEVIVTESGLQYEVISEGDGDKPEFSDTVQVHYEGMLADGSVFDSSHDPEHPSEFPLEAVISGWSEGLQLMSVGSTYRLYIPSELAYGEKGANPIIPPYSTLIFTVELVDIIKQPLDMEDDPDQTE